MSKSFHIVTLGCPKNIVDSKQIYGYLVSLGFVPEKRVELANIIVVNTCGFILDAKQESIEEILRLSQWKARGKCQYLIAAGCLVQKYAEELRKEIPEIDAYLGTGSIHRLPELISEWHEQKIKRPILKLGPPDDFLYNEKFSGISTLPESAAHYAYIKIAEGCDNRCSYCVIPSLRGAYRSRKIENIVTEVGLLASKGMKEAILVAQDTTNYGMDIYDKHMLSPLIRKLSDISELKWIRLLYCYPNHINDDLIMTIKEEDKVCKYLDIPLQHIADNTLKRMGRPFLKNDIIRLLEKIKSQLPEIVLRTTFIVGFPGETEDDFQELLAFIREFEFDRAGFFTYSREPDTKAYYLPEQVEEQEKERRLFLASSLQKEILAKKQEKFLNKTIKVIVDGPSSDCNEHWEGRTAGDAPEIDGIVYFNPQKRIEPGSFIKLRVTHCQEFELIGEIVDESRQ